VELLGPAQVRALADALQIRPTKSLGQNFVHDGNTVRRIARAAGVGGNDVVLEIGPGLGSLTLALLETGATVLAVEIDAPEHADRLTVITADALTLQPADLPLPPTALVANLPYNVAVPVLLTVMQRFGSLTDALVMVQSEVADRLAAAPGSRVYGGPSVKARWYGDVTRAGAVPRGVFWPVPNVDSGLVSLRRQPPPAGADREAVFAVVDAAFAQRRKTLRAALAGWAGSAPEAERRLRAAGIDPSARGETLNLADFARLAATP
jgi:16S rRNA (adenine1518-N6/adenine1519-N6)-dimethyltransferase